MPRDLTESQTNCHFEVSPYLILHNINKPFLDQIVMCDENWILYDNWWWPSSVGLHQEEAPRHLPKPNLYQKRSWSLLGGLLPIWSTTIFGIQVKPLHLRRCSANQWDELKTAMPAAGIGQQKGCNSLWQHPAAHHTTNASKVKQIELRSFASSVIFIQPFANWLPFLQASWQLLAVKILYNQQDAENVCWILKHGFSCYNNI